MPRATVLVQRRTRAGLSLSGFDSAGDIKMEMQPTPDMNDWELLRAYAVNHAERAFDLLVERVNAALD